EVDDSPTRQDGPVRRAERMTAGVTPPDRLHATATDLTPRRSGATGLAVRHHFIQLAAVPTLQNVLAKRVKIRAAAIATPRNLSSHRPSLRWARSACRVLPNPPSRPTSTGWARSGKARC